MKYRYFITSETNPFRNLATEEALLKNISNEEAVLFLWQNQKTIVIGRNQDAHIECRIEKFISAGGTIARRRSGGGAVYHDLGNLNYSLLSTVDAAEEIRYQDIIIKALRGFDIIATYNGRNDILVEGKKFSGNAIYKYDNLLCQHGTILINSDIDKMVYYLTPEQSKLDRNHISSVYSRVINLGEIHPNINVVNVMQALIDTVEARKLIQLPNEDLVNEMTSFYKSDSWVYGGNR